MIDLAQLQAFDDLRPCLCPGIIPQQGFTQGDQEGDFKFLRHFELIAPDDYASFLGIKKGEDIVPPLVTSPILQVYAADTPDIPEMGEWDILMFPYNFADCVPDLFDIQQTVAGFSMPYFKIFKYLFDISIFYGRNGWIVCRQRPIRAAEIFAMGYFVHPLREAPPR